MFICNDPELARHAVVCGTDRIFVDLEINGKQERQGHKDTVVSRHTLVDVHHMRAVVGNAELLVRVNPMFGGTEKEVDEAISAGADILMLPMFETADELSEFVSLVDGRVKIIPLVETVGAVKSFDSIVKVENIAEFYFGLNDLHLALGLNFMFELLADGTVEKLATACDQVKVPFGFGGIARMDEGLVPGSLVLAEHMRLGSSSVILSRTFHRRSKTIGDLLSTTNFEREIASLREFEETLLSRDSVQIQADHKRLIQCVNAVVARSQK
ncbi:MAG: aldolase [Oceanospirillales bacterium TMED33]|nr:aldolase [Gammaproteobacteria bacterium]RPG22836.1 MAG: aldolase [Oceanospirillales bacterium TMED33]